ncbi:MAG: hypothetical protein HON04_09175 [Planctomicrobium sp.]|nr:hypothetical protein [Planctomicrobium sp.]
MTDFISLQSITRSALLMCVVLSAAEVVEAEQFVETAPDAIIATVNGQELTSANLNLSFFAIQLSADSAPQAKAELIETLVDRELVRQFLSKRKVKADKILVEQRMNAVKKMIENKGDNLTEVLNKAGLSEDSLQAMIAQQITWKTYVNSVLTESQIKEFWGENKEKFDGTELVAAQIFKKVKQSASEEQIKKEMRSVSELKASIEAKEMTFADAAKLLSESPSAKSGGALGSFEYYGQVAQPIAEAAFSTSPGSISDPIRSRYGIHIVQVQKRIPGDLSLEDARPQVVKVLSKELWEELVIRLRKSARIVYTK